MSIHKYPNYLDFIKNEKNTLSFLANATFITNSAFSSLSACAQNSFYELSLKDKYLEKKAFKFGCNFNIEVEKCLRTIIIEAQVQPNFSIVSYVLSICENTEPPFHLLRKFHFDYALPIKNQEPKPVYHVQYGGETSPHLELLKINTASLSPWLSSPRIRFYPLNLALFLDMIFCEFKSNETNAIIERDEWRGLIKNNEDSILRPFYLGISTFINSNHTSNNLLRDFYSR